MPFSEYLDSMREDCRGLVAELGRYFDYVSILGTDVRATVYRADRKLSMVREGAGECGFVIKMHSGRSFYEYSCDSIEGDKKALAAKIAGSVKIAGELTERQIKTREVADTPMKRISRAKTILRTTPTASCSASARRSPMTLRRRTKRS